MKRLFFAVTTVFVLIIVISTFFRRGELLDSDNTSSSSLEHERRLLQWAKERNFEVNVEPAYFFYPGRAQPVRGVRATKDLAVDDVVVFVPRQYLIGVETIKLDSKLGFLANILPEETLICFYVLYQRALAERSEFYYFLKVLDSAPLEHPIFYSAEKLSKETSHLRKMVYERLKLCLEMYEKFTDLMKEYPALFEGIDRTQFNENTTVWSYAMFLSRFWNLPWDSDESFSFMVPLADLLNHGISGRTYAEYNIERQGFEITAQDNFKRNDEVTFFYANMCRDEFLLEYGFVTDQEECE